MGPLLYRFNDKGKLEKDLLVCLVFAAIVYLLYILLPAVFKGMRLDGDGDVAYQWLNLPHFVCSTFHFIWSTFSIRLNIERKK